jgi:hypothetical protein
MVETVDAVCIGGSAKRKALLATASMFSNGPGALNLVVRQRLCTISMYWGVEEIGKMQTKEGKEIKQQKVKGKE